MGIIAQGSINIDENAKLAEDAHEVAASNGRDLVIFKNDMSAQAQQIRQQLADAVKANDANRDALANVQADMDSKLNDQINNQAQSNQALKNFVNSLNSQTNQAIQNLNDQTNSQIQAANDSIQAANNNIQNQANQLSSTISSNKSYVETALQSVSDNINSVSSNINSKIDNNDANYQAKFKAANDLLNTKINDLKDQVGHDYTLAIAEAQQQQNTLLEGKLTTSFSNPRDATANNQVHHSGDVWIQLSQTNRNGQVDINNKDQVIQSAVGMYHFVQKDENDPSKGGSWVEQNWDQEMLSVEHLSALTANLGDVQSGSITGTNIVGGTLALDLNGGGFAQDGGYNPLAWDNNGVDFKAQDQWGMGLHAQNGLISIKGHRVNWVSDAGSFDTTLIGPNDIKLRQSRDTTTDNGSIYDRVDIRTNYIEIASHYGTPLPRGNKGCNLGSDGTAIISDILNVPFIQAGFKKGHITINSVVDGNYSINAPNIGNSSDLSLKNVHSSFSNKKALSEILGTDIYSYTYRGDNETRNIGPVIDDVHGVDKAQYNTSEYLVYHGDKNDSIALQNAVALLIGSVHELSDQNEKLLARVLKLEAQNNGNN